MGFCKLKEQRRTSKNFKKIKANQTEDTMERGGEYVDGFLPLVGYPKWKVRCSTAAVSLSKDAKVEIDQ